MQAGMQSKKGETKKRAITHASKQATNLVAHARSMRRAICAMAWLVARQLLHAWQCVKIIP